MPVTDIVLIVILVVLVVALFVFSYMRKKKFNSELGQMRADLKIGDRVMTDTGVVGEVVDSYTEENYKYFVLKTGRGNNIGYFSVHANAIYYVFDKEPAKKENFNAKQKKDETTDEAEQNNPDQEPNGDNETKKSDPAKVSKNNKKSNKK